MTYLQYSIIQLDHKQKYFLPIFIIVLDFIAFLSIAKVWKKFILQVEYL